VLDPFAYAGEVVDPVLHEVPPPPLLVRVTFMVPTIGLQVGFVEVKVEEPHSETMSVFKNQFAKRVTEVVVEKFAPSKYVVPEPFAFVDQPKNSYPLLAKVLVLREAETPEVNVCVAVDGVPDPSLALKVTVLELLAQIAVRVIFEAPTV
jgi:hypothetical protein